MNYRKCEICGIRSERKDGIKRHFMARYPLDEDRCKKWVQMTGNEDLAYIPIEKLHQLKFVCGKHFNDKDFTKKKTQLKKIAIPSKNLTAQPLSDSLLLEFPFHQFKEKLNQLQDCAANTSLESERIMFECDIPSVENTIEVCTSGQIQDFAANTSLESERIMYECEIPSVENTIEICTSGHVQVIKKRKKVKDSKQIDSEQLTPRKKKLVKRIKKYKLKLKLIEKQLKVFNNISSKALKTIINSACRNQNRSAQGNRWTENDKALALAMFKKSPKLYRYLRELIPLPSIRTLQTILSKVPIQPGFNKNVMDHLRRKANEFSDKNKTCVILFDEMSLKKRLIYNPGHDIVEGYKDLGEHGREKYMADKALVLLLQGVHLKFKQPLAHYFVTKTISSEKLAIILKNAINVVSDLGFKIIATVCDQGPTNIGALNLLKKMSRQPPESNSFLINNESIYIIYDIPHLLKSIRNNFFEAGEIVFGGKKARWSHLVELQEKNKETLHFKKITGLHVNPTFRAKMKVKLAAQIFSNDVAAILKLYAETFRDEEEYDGQKKRDAILLTAQVIQELDILFDITNGPASKKDIKKGIRVNVSSNSIHHKLWPEFKNKIKGIHFLKSDSALRLRNVRCVNGYYTSITSLQNVWRYVQSIGFKYLNLRQLNQDSLENLFGLIRQHCPTNKNPTCQHFTAALKTTMLTKLSTPIRGANCESDNNELILDFQDLVFKKNDMECTRNEDHFYTEPSGMYDEPFVESDYVLHLPEIEEDDIEECSFSAFNKQPVVYVSGYLASVLIARKRITCEKCCNSLRTLTPGNDAIYNYISLREWWKDKLSLTYPTLQLCKTVDKCVSVFENDVKHSLHVQNIGKYCHLMMLKEVDFTWLCEDHKNNVMKMLLSLLTVLLIRNECKKINLTISSVEELNSDKNKVAQLLSLAK